jgi:hypothetical protein
MVWHPVPENPRWRLWSGYARTDIDGAGILKFWPFTPTVLDILGPQRTAVADTYFKVMSSGIRYQTPSSAYGWASLALDLHYAWTDGNLISWEPQVLGLGRANVLQDRLQLKSAQLLDLGCAIGLPVTGEIDLEVGLTQLIPLATQKRAAPVSPAPPGVPGPRARTVWGGLRWWVGFSIRSPD